MQVQHILPDFVWRELSCMDFCSRGFVMWMESARLKCVALMYCLDVCRNRNMLLPLLQDRMQALLNDIAGVVKGVVVVLFFSTNHTTDGRQKLMLITLKSYHALCLCNR